jgi:hypothetical protein
MFIYWYLCTDEHCTALERVDYFLISSPGHFACRAGTRALPAGTHETKKKVFFNSFFMFMYLSSKHAEMHSNTLLLPFY